MISKIPVLERKSQGERSKHSNFAITWDLHIGSLTTDTFRLCTIAERRLEVNEVAKSNIQSYTCEIIKVSNLFHELDTKVYKLETPKSKSLLGFISNEASILSERDPVSSPFLQLAVRGPCLDNCSKSVDLSFVSFFYDFHDSIFVLFFFPFFFVVAT